MPKTTISAGAVNHGRLPNELLTQVVGHSSGDVDTLRSLSLTDRNFAHESQPHLFERLTVEDDTRKDAFSSKNDAEHIVTHWKEYVGDGPDVSSIMKVLKFLGTQRHLLPFVKHVDLWLNGELEANKMRLHHHPCLSILLGKLSSKLPNLRSLHICRDDDDGPIYRHVSTSHMDGGAGTSFDMASFVGSLDIQELTVSNISLDMHYFLNNSLPESLEKLVLHRSAIITDGCFNETELDDYRNPDDIYHIVPSRIKSLELSDGEGLLNLRNLVTDILLRFIDVSALEYLKLPLMCICQQDNPDTFMSSLNSLFKDCASTLHSLELLSVDEVVGQQLLSAELDLSRLSNLYQLTWHLDYYGERRRPFEDLSNVLRSFINHPKQAPSLLRIELSIIGNDPNLWFKPMNHFAALNNDTLVPLLTSIGQAHRALQVQVVLDVYAEHSDVNIKSNFAANISIRFISIWKTRAPHLNSRYLQLKFHENNDAKTVMETVDGAHFQVRLPDGRKVSFRHSQLQA